MVLFGVLIDGMQFLIGLFVLGLITSFISIAGGAILTGIAWIVLFIWYGLLGISSDTRIMARSLATAIASFFLEIFTAGFAPTVTIGVIAVYFIEKAELTLGKATGALKK